MLILTIPVLGLHLSGVRPAFQKIWHHTAYTGARTLFVQMRPRRCITETFSAQGQNSSNDNPSPVGTSSLALIMCRVDMLNFSVKLWLVPLGPFWSPPRNNGSIDPLHVPWHGVLLIAQSHTWALLALATDENEITFSSGLASIRYAKGQANDSEGGSGTRTLSRINYQKFLFESICLLESKDWL